MGKALFTGLILGTASFLIGCDRSSQKSSPAQQSQAAAPTVDSPQQPSLSEEQVADIVNAVVEKNAQKAKQLLTATPALVNAKFNGGGPVDGWPLIMIAARSGDKAMCDLLIDAKANVNARNNSNEVALHYAAREGHKDVVQLLLNNGAEVGVKNDAHMSPLKAATVGGHPEVAEMLRKAGATE